MKRIKALLLSGVLALSLVLTACGNSGGSGSSGSSGNSGTAANTSNDGGLIKVGVINNPPSESGYREANVKDMEAVFSEANGYELKTFYSLKNDEQLQAAQGFITEGDESLSCLKLLVIL